jgi:hypothetical protein
VAKVEVVITPSVDRTEGTARGSIRLVVLALVVGLGGGWVAHDASMDDAKASVRVVEGWAYQAGTSGGIGCCGDTEDDAGGSSYSVKGILWRDLAAPAPSWTEADGSPECLGANTPELIRMGVVDVRPHDDAPGGPRAVWLECL